MGWGRKIKSNPFASTGKLPKERWNTEVRGRRQKHKQYAGGKEFKIRLVSRSQTGAACNENPISHTKRRGFIGYKSFRRLLLLPAKNNIEEWGLQDTKTHTHIQKKLFCLAFCILRQLKCFCTCLCDEAEKPRVETYFRTYLLARKLKLQNVPVRSEGCKQLSRNSL